MNRFYLIDKPIWISSFDIIRDLRKKLNIKKIGHTWTLDPLATWAVILAVWNYTKLIPYLEKDKKTYEFTISIDWLTDSFDLAEKVHYLSVELQEKYKKDITKEKIVEILKQKFTWKIIQVPPKYCALKINWQRAYKLAREWKDIKMKSRVIEIFNIELLSYNYPKIKIKAEVSAGTYVRSIAMDLGQILGTGWYITKLRRTKIGDLDISKSQTLDKFDEKNTLDIKKLFKNKAFISLEDSILNNINNGMKVKGNFDYKIWEDFFIYNKWNITNIVEYNWKILIPKKII